MIAQHFYETIGLKWRKLKMVANQQPSTREHQRSDKLRTSCFGSLLTITQSNCSRLQQPLNIG